MATHKDSQFEYNLKKHKRSLVSIAKKLEEASFKKSELIAEISNWKATVTIFLENVLPASSWGHVKGLIEKEEPRGVGTEYEIIDYIINLAKIIEEIEKNAETYLSGAQVVHGSNIFIIHGRNKTVRDTVTSHIKREFNIAPMVLAEIQTGGKSLIQSLEELADSSGFCIALFTGDDELITPDSKRVRQARPNVLFELGWFYGKFKNNKENICILLESNTELPSDINGVKYIGFSGAPNEEVLQQMRQQIQNWMASKKLIDAD